MSPTSTSIPQHETMPAKSAALKVLLAVLRLGIGIGLLVYLVLSGIIDLRVLLKLVTAWPITLAAVALLMFDVFLMSLRLCWLFRPQDLHLSLRMSLQLTLVGFFFATFVPGSAGGDIARLFYATRENGGRKTEIMTVVIIDRVIGLFSMLLLPLLFAPMFPKLIHGVPVLRYLLISVAFLALCLLAAFVTCVWNQSLLTLLGREAFGFPKWRRRHPRTPNSSSLSPQSWDTAISPRSFNARQFVSNCGNGARDVVSKPLESGDENVPGDPDGLRREQFTFDSWGIGSWRDSFQ
jgi:uncharacterized membrane protein YbhN (UPF0104 family)